MRAPEEFALLFDPLTGQIQHCVGRYTVYPSSHYVTPRDRILAAVETIKLELKERLDQQGMEATPGTPSELRPFLVSQNAQWLKVVRAAGVKAD